jgi:hypothetical protein
VQITVELTEEQTHQLQRLSEALGIEPAELAQAAFVDLLARPAEDFRRASARVLKKNEELYRRLS